MTTSRYHRLHPVTAVEIDYDKTCASCARFATRTIKKQTVHECGHVGRINHPGQSPPAYPGCALWTRRS